MTRATTDCCEIGARDAHPDHPCTDPALYGSDEAMLAYMLQDLRSLARTLWLQPTLVGPYSTLEWLVHGFRRSTVVCDPSRLRSGGDVCIVGFFGERRDDAPGQLVDEFEVDLRAEFTHYPGILSYSSMELVGDQWANLVVVADRDDTERWRQSHVHGRAVIELSPLLYRSVRIHNGFLPSGPSGTEQIRIEHTKYWDYGDDDSLPVWRARRDLIV